MRPLTAGQEARRNDVAVAAARSGERHDDPVRSESERVLDVRGTRGMAWRTRKPLKQTGVLDRHPLTLTAPPEIAAKPSSVVGEHGLGARLDKGDGLMTGQFPPRNGRPGDTENGLRRGKDERLQESLGRTSASSGG